MCSPSTGTVDTLLSAHVCRVDSGRHPDGYPLVEGLQMSAFVHRPVMLGEVVELFGSVPPGAVVDATVGGGGHSAALLDAHQHLTVVGLDRDLDALDAAGSRLARFGERARLVHTRFDRMAEVVDGPVSGVLLDLGVSSWQLDAAERGFSYRADAPLDMRMDRNDPRTAADVVNGATEEALTRLFRENGEHRFARRIARAVVAARPVTTTGHLADVVRDAIPAPARRTGGHPAKKVFQAVRIAVNAELEVLGPALDAALGLLAPGGRCVVLAYHSGEDRIVKDRFRTAATGGCVCPPGLPCVCGATPTVRLVFQSSRKPSATEVAENPRAESARLRAAERLAAPTTPPVATGGTR